MSNPLRLKLATRNAHKTQEFAALLGPEFSVRDLRDEPDLPVIEETGSSFEENASLKALAISRRRSGWVVADDSGLEVDVLDGAPGIYSARYAGEAASDAENIARLLAEPLLRAAHSPHAAQFHCALALARGERVEAIFHGIVRGEVVLEARGANGFGYDPVFVPDGFTQTFAELGAAVKNRISHRAQAVSQLRDYLRK